MYSEKAVDRRLRHRHGVLKDALLSVASKATSREHGLDMSRCSKEEIARMLELAAQERHALDTRFRNLSNVIRGLAGITKSSSSERRRHRSSHPPTRASVFESSASSNLNAEENVYKGKTSRKMKGCGSTDATLRIMGGLKSSSSSCPPARRNSRVQSTQTARPRGNNEEAHYSLGENMLDSFQEAPPQ
ncbi:unnamed protein product, partial [Discosporangium mesarthrocarpum]